MKSRFEFGFSIIFLKHRCLRLRDGLQPLPIPRLPRRGIIPRKVRHLGDAQPHAGDGDRGDVVPRCRRFRHVGEVLVVVGAGAEVELGEYLAGVPAVRVLDA